MRPKRKKNRICIEPPIVDVDNILSDTTGKERFEVFEVLASMKKTLVGMLLTSAFLSLLVFIEVVAGVQLFSSPISYVNFFAIAYIAVTSIITGLLLLCSE